MPKRSANEMREEYDFSELQGGVRGKYYQQAKVGTNLVLIDPDLAKVFPDGESVNRALRLLLEAANDATEASRRSRKGAKKALKPRPKKPARIIAGR
jgi:hypothetical protein